MWLGRWSGRPDPPVNLHWNSSKLKILGVFIGVGDLESDNWRPRIDAVHRVLKSWRSRSLSFQGKALINNALALFRIWYVASLIPMPAWALKELYLLVFTFFWSGKRELVSRVTVSQPSLFGGFAVVDIKLKVWALLGQWVRRFPLPLSVGPPFFLTGVSPVSMPPRWKSFPVPIHIPPESCRISTRTCSLPGVPLMDRFQFLGTL